MTLKLRTKMAAGVLVLGAATFGVVAVNGQGGGPVEQAPPAQTATATAPQKGLPQIDETAAIIHAEVDGATFLAGRRTGGDDMCAIVTIPSGAKMAGCGLPDDPLVKGVGYIVQHEGTGTKTVYGIAPRGATTITSETAEAAVKDGAYVITVPADATTLLAAWGSSGEVTISIPGSQI